MSAEFLRHLGERCFRRHRHQITRHHIRCRDRPGPVRHGLSLGCPDEPREVLDPEVEGLPIAFEDPSQFPFTEAQTLIRCRVLRAVRVPVIELPERIMAPC